MESEGKVGESWGVREPGEEPASIPQGKVNQRRWLGKGGSRFLKGFDG